MKQKVKILIFSLIGCLAFGADDGEGYLFDPEAKETCYAFEHWEALKTHPKSTAEQIAEQEDVKNKWVAAYEDKYKIQFDWNDCLIARRCLSDSAFYQEFKKAKK